MNPEKNYFLVNRKLLDSKRWLEEPFTRAQAWIDLIGLAQHHTSSFYIRGNRVEINRGQLAYASETLAARWQWSRGKVRRYLELLEKEGNIVQQKNPIITIITVIGYDRWQGNGTTDSTTESQQKANRRTHTKKDNKDKEGINPSEADASHVVNEIIDAFKDVNPLYKEFFRNTTERGAVKAMLESVGHDQLLASVQALAGIINKPYAPKITKPTELRRDFGKLIAFYRQEKTKLQGSNQFIL